MQKTILVTSAVLGAAAVAIGAFGAHGLKELISPDKITIYKTGVDYHFYHTLALLAVGLLSFKLKSKLINFSAIAFVVGILLFSGSLYLLATAELHSIPKAILGPATPIGGFFFIIGWILLGIAAILKKPFQQS